MYGRVFVAVDARAPDFTLKDENGREITLSACNKDKKLVLAFVPGVDNAHTLEQLDYLKDDYERFKFHGADVLAVTFGSVQFNKKLCETHKLPFHILSDPDCNVIKEYGLYNQYDKLLGPAILVLNKAGTIMFMYAGKNPGDITVDEEIIKVLEGDTQSRPGWPEQG
jgi:peroxiredoxin Q/BCP